MKFLIKEFKEMGHAAYYTIGFTLYDLLHLTCGIYFLITAFASKNGNWEMDVAASVTEIGMAILLITFVSTLVAKEYRPEDASQHYSYCWLIASMSIILPEIFEIPYLLSESSGVSASLGIALLSVSGVAFIFFLISCFETTNAGIWRVLDWIGLALFTTVGILLLAQHIAEKSYTPVDLIFGILHGLAPLVPVTCSALDFIKTAKERKAKKEQQ